LKASYRYPAGALAADYLRGGLGLAATAGPLAFVDPTPGLAWILAAAAALFLVYCARTVCRQLTIIELDETGIRASGPLGAGIRWDELRSMRLDYYSTRRDREGGWMQLKLHGAGRAMRIDSELEHFAGLVRAAAGEARRHGHQFDQDSRDNLKALGLADL
jgi:hypothetical protein